MRKQARFTMSLVTWTGRHHDIRFSSQDAEGNMELNLPRHQPLLVILSLEYHAEHHAVLPPGFQDLPPFKFGHQGSLLPGMESCVGVLCNRFEPARKVIEQLRGIIKRVPSEKETEPDTSQTYIAR